MINATLQRMSLKTGEKKTEGRGLCWKNCTSREYKWCTKGGESEKHHVHLKIPYSDLFTEIN